MKKINIGIVAHVDAGKTTVTENLLYYSGVIKETGRVDSGNTQTDSMELERKRGISIKSSPISFTWNDVKINIIDTPGHVDFISEVERSLSVLDGAILIVSAKEGIQSQTRILFDTLKALNIPTIIFINKIDRVGVDYRKLIKELKTTLSDKIVSLQTVYNEGSKTVSISELFEERIIDDIINVLSELDEDILVSYVNDVKTSKEDLDNKITFYAKKGCMYPVLCGSALLGLGIEKLIDAIPRYLPFSDGKKEDSLSGVVFKIQRDNINEKKVYVRLFQGEISLRDTIEIANRNIIEKAKKINVLKNGRLIEVSTISAGDIGVVYGLENLKIGDVIGSQCNKIKKVSIAKPTIKTKISPANKGDKNKLFSVLTLLAEEDPLLELETDDTENDTFINLFGEIQMEILKALLMDSYNIEVEFSDTTTIYKETPKGIGSARMCFYENGNPFAAGVGIKVEPIKRGEGIQYVSQVSYGSLEKPFQNAVKEAVLQTCKQGLLGWEVTDIKVTFDFSQYSSVTSTPADFRDLTPMVLMEALDSVKTDLLEPYYEFELKVPRAVGGRAVSDLKKIYAVLNEPTANEDEFIVKGLIPVDTSKNYSLELASYTEGKGVFFTKFYGYKTSLLNLGKSRKKAKVDPLNKKMYLMHKLNAIRN